MIRQRALHRRAFQRLYEAAEAQQGYFTAKQAKDAGFDERNHPYHVRAGNWVRERRSLYRLTRFPPADRPDLVLASLWSMDRKGVIQGTFSHETALTLYDLSDAMPARLHMTVPPTFRRTAPPPKGLLLHKGALRGEDVEERQGYRVTKPLTTLADLVAEGRISPDLLQQAAKEALDRGLLRLSAVRQAKHLPESVREQLTGLAGGASS